MAVSLFLLIFLVNFNNGLKLNNPAAVLQIVETTIYCANNGVLKSRICQCKPEFSGKYCEKSKNCHGYERFANGS